MRHIVGESVFVSTCINKLRGKKTFKIMTRRRLEGDDSSKVKDYADGMSQ